MSTLVAIRGAAVLVLISLNTIFWAIPLFSMACRGGPGAT